MCLGSQGSRGKVADRPAFHPFCLFPSLSYNLLTPVRTRWGSSPLPQLRTACLEGTQSTEGTTSLSQETGPPRGSGRASQHSGEEIYGKDLLKDHSPADAYTQLPVLPDGGLVSAQLLKPPVELLNLV